MSTSTNIGVAHPVGDPQRGQVRWLLGFARPATTRLALSTLARTLHLLLGAALLALPAWAAGELVARGAGRALPGLVPPVEGGARFVAWVLLACVLLAVLKAALRYAEQLLGHLAAFGLLAELRVWVLDHLAPQAPAVVDGEGAGTVVSVAHRDIDRIEVFFAHTIAPAVTALLVPGAAVLVGGLWAGWPTGLTLAAVMAIGLVVPWVGARGGSSGARETAQVRTRLAQELTDDVRAREEIASFGAREQRLDRLEALDAELAVLAARTGRRAGVRSLLTTLRVWGGTVLVLLVALTTVPAGETIAEAMSGALVAATLVPGTAAALDVVERLAVSLPAGLEATRRLRALAARPPAVRDGAGGAESADDADETAEDEGCAGDGARPVTARLEGVSFAYPGRPESGVREIDLTVAPGQVIAVVGATGSGKSSVLRLLQRRWDVDAGRVTLESRDVRELPLSQVWRQVVVADQNAVVLEASVRENLTFGSDVPEEALWHALRLACLADVVSGLPQGLDTPLGGHGVRLSGGQEQRLTLARALLRAGEDALLVLDEATSHQDPATQDAVMAHLAGRRGGTLVIAHRLSTIRGADEIVVLEAGRVVERGTWDQLEDAGGAFTRLLRAGA